MEESGLYQASLAPSSDYTLLKTGDNNGKVALSVIIGHRHIYITRLNTVQLVMKCDIWPSLGPFVGIQPKDHEAKDDDC